MEALYFFICSDKDTSSCKINDFLCFTNIDKYGLDYGIEAYLSSEFDDFNWLNKPSIITIGRVIGWSIMYIFMQTSIIEFGWDLGRLNVRVHLKMIRKLRFWGRKCLFVCYCLAASPPTRSDDDDDSLGALKCIGKNANALSNINKLKMDTFARFNFDDANSVQFKYFCLYATNDHEVCLVITYIKSRLCVLYYVIWTPFQYKDSLSEVCGFLC